MTEGETQVFWRKNNPIAYGVAISVGLLAVYLVIGLRNECIGSFCENNFQRFWDSEPNQIGDTLAGLFGTLAFVWIIVTVFLQSQELREQRKEFREQRVATQDMARAMAAQAEIFNEEQNQRLQDRANMLLESLLVSMKYWLLLLPEKNLISQIFGFGVRVRFTGRTIEPVYDYDKDDDTDDFYFKMRQNLMRASIDIAKGEANQFTGEFEREKIEKFRLRLIEIMELNELVSQDQVRRMDMLAIKEYLTVCEEILNGTSPLLATDTILS